MALSRLENFLKNYEGNLIYVNPTDFDATDSYDNQGNSLTRPFKTIQRALIEAARFSYQSGRNNDKIDKTTILVYPGTHYVDNRPGYSIQNVNNTAVVKRKTGATTWVSDSLPELNENTNFDILDTNNDLYKFNSVNGGAILPRGTSIIGLDLRKTKVRPLYVPNPEDDTVENSSIFNVTGTCYFTAFTFFDASTATTVFKDYTANRYVPEFSHHKLVAFAYADGVNKVKLGYQQTDLTDLDMYYYKISKFYGQFTGRALAKYPSALDFESSPEEFKIVGQVQANPLGISSIYSGDGLIPSSTITVTTKDFLTGEPKEHGLQVDSPVLITGVTIDSGSYNGSFTVKDVIGLTTFTYTAISTPTNPVPTDADPAALDTASAILESDTVNSASPYVFNCSLRSVYGLCGLWADGSKADGFKSMVVAQFTGVSLQKDDNAFILYQNGTYYDNLTLPQGSTERPLHTNSNSIYRPNYQNFHIRCSNGAFIQCVSVFAIGYSRHFYAESGGDMSITNSNSNFGAVSLESSGFRNDSFDRDDVGYVTHVIPPKESTSPQTTVSWLALDGDKIRTAGISTQKLYLYGYNDANNPPISQISGYRIGAKNNDKLYLVVTSGLGQTTYSSPILMPVPSGSGVSSKKSYTLGRNAGINSISSSNVLTLTQNHQLLNGENLRIFSDTGQAPFGLSVDTIYYAITNGLNANQLRLALSYNDAISGNHITGIGNNGGIISVISTVSDKFPGDVGHPVGFDTSVNNWYVTGSDDITNQISSVIVGGGITTKTNNTYITRKSEDRLVEDRIYKVRYVIPKEYLYVRVPRQGFVLQESKTVGVSSVSYSSVDINDAIDLRNEKIIVNATSGAITNNSQVVTITTELPHNFSVGDKANIQKVKSTNNPTAIGITSTYNGSYYITSVPTLRTFTYTITGVSTNPGTFTNTINARSTSQQRNALPLVSREEYSNSYKVYKVDTVRNHIPGTNGQDGVYYLTLLSSNAKSSPTVGYGISTLRFSQDVRNLYPQTDRDNFNSDPYAAISYADEQKISKVITDDKKKSITKESLDLFIKDSNIGFGITGISISGTGNTTVTIYTDVEHRLNPIKSVSFLSAGSGFAISSSFYNAGLINSSSQEYATAKFDTTAGGAIDTNTFSLVYTGSACGVGSTYIISGGTTNAVVQVTSIINNVNDGLELIGFNDQQLKGVFKILSVDNRKILKIYAPNGVNNYVPNTNGFVPSAYLASKGIGITSFKYTNVSSGIVTVTTSTPHGLNYGNKILIIESGTTVYNGNFVVSSVVGLNTFTINVGVATTNPSSVKGTLLKRGFSANSSVYGTGQEGRATSIYAGITTSITAKIDKNSTTIQLSSSNGFKRGDYINVGKEIIRLASNPTSNTFNVLRSQLGTFREENVEVGSLVKKIKVLASEFRRPSFLRASGHTFEYLGYGPGNYSNSLPQKQTRTLDSDDVTNSQARKSNSGLIVYNGINDLGENYTGAKKTLYNGQEVVVEAPIITYTGDDASQQLGSLVNSDFDDVLIRRTLTVEGGENGTLSSQFYGPVEFTRKLTNNSTDGVEIKNLYLSGLNVAQPKLITVDNDAPTTIERGPGSISFLSTPSSHIGNVYVSEQWRPFGLISKTPGALNFQVDKLGIGIDNSNNVTYDFDVANNTRLNNLRVTGTLVLDQPQVLGDVQFEDINITGITTVQTILDSTGFTTTKNICVSGIATFFGDANFKGNLGIANTLTVDKNLIFSNPNTYLRWEDNTDYAFIRFNSTSDSNPPSQLEIAIGDNGNSASTGGADNLVVNQYATNNAISRSLKLLDQYGNTIVPENLGIGTTRPNAKLEVLGTGVLVSVFGNSSSNITHDINIKRSSSSSLIAQGPNIRLDDGTTNNNIVIQNSQGNLTFWNYGFGTWNERLRIGYAGTITYSQNNSGRAASGANFIIKQSGTGDSVISWRNDNGNANQSWYAGIDASDSYKWKLAKPATTVSSGSESFTNDTKLTIDVNGNANLLGNFVSSSIGTLNQTTTLNGLVSIAQTLTLANTTANRITAVLARGADNNFQLSAQNGPANNNSGQEVARFGIYYSGAGWDTYTQYRRGGGAQDGSITFGVNGSVGIATVTSNGLNATKFVKSNLGFTNNYGSGGEYNFLRTDGSDSALTTKDIVNVLGFIPQPPVATSDLPTGNSSILDNFQSQFDGSRTTFSLTISGTAFVPLGPYNLLVVLGGVMQKPAADYIIQQSGSSYTNTIQFTDAPASGTSCFIIALGGQGSLTANQDWSAAGQLIVSTADNSATTLNAGTNNQILTVDTSLATKMKWSSTINCTSVTATTFTGSLSGNATSVTNGVYTTGDQTIGGNKTFSNTISANISGNAGTATKFSSDRTNYKSVTDDSVVGQLMWKNYGNNHTIFDASNSLSPSGTSVNNTDAAVAWTATYPTLMGWNGSSTYGVRVDSARVADYATNAGSANYATSAGSANYATSAGSAAGVSNGVISASKLNGGQTGSAPIYGVRAWGNVNESGAFDYGANISNTDRTSTGTYTIQFETNMSNGLYVVVVTIDEDPGTGSEGLTPYVYDRFAGSFKVRIRKTEAGGAGDIEAQNAPFNFMVIQ